MVQSRAKTVAAYLKELPAECRKVLAAVRKAILRRLPAGYEEAMNWGMITYQVPLSRLAETYNGQPLCYAGIAAQKNSYSLHIMCAYGSKKLQSRLHEGFKRAGKKLDMGKACIRFKCSQDLPLDVIGEVIAAVPVDQFVAIYEQSRKRPPRTARRRTAAD